MSHKLYTDYGLVSMSLEGDDSILPDIIMSLTIKKGSVFYDSTFGQEIYKVDRISDDAVDLVRMYAMEALQWMLDIGRAIKIEVEAEINAAEPNRIDYKVMAMQPNGLIVSWQNFKEII